MTENQEPALPISPRLVRKKQYRPRFRAVLTDVQFNRLQQAAARRAINPHLLLDRIILTVLEHNLIDAVLDD